GATAGVASLSIHRQGWTQETPAEANRVDSAVIHSTSVITPSQDTYCGWPTLTRRTNGQLLVVWSGGRQQHVCPFGRVELMRSDDEGETWTWPRTVIDGSIDDRDAGVLETDSGAILVTTFTSLAYENYELKKALASRGQPNAWPEEKLQRWLRVHDRMSEEQRQRELGQWMIRSTDGGVTWSKRYSSIVNSPHGPIQLADGRLLYAGVKLWSDSRDVGVCQSADDGASWQWLAEITPREGDDPKNYHELHAVEAKDGRLVVHIRNHNPANKSETLQCESTDGGQSWSQPRSIGVWGLPSFLLRMRDGRLLMSYGYRRKPYGNQARVSHDHGETWGPPLTISEDGIGHDLGYPSTVELNDGKLLTVWYERMADSPMAVLRQAKWSIEA
ncbi:MAG: sialidase family protein, partial [Rubripirellula sp.]